MPALTDQVSVTPPTIQGPTKPGPERPAILASVQGDDAGGRVGSEQGGIVLRTARLSLLPLTGLDEAEHARASRNPEDALRDTHAAGPQWRGGGLGSRGHTGHPQRDIFA